jgi:hypothetical protein
VCAPADRPSVWTGCECRRTGDCRAGLDVEHQWAVKRARGGPSVLDRQAVRAHQMQPCTLF